jgi:hypothetical protein
VVRTEKLPSEEIEFLRWRAERWMKLSHFPIALVRNPRFVLKQGMKMLRHTFRGCTWRTLLGVEDERKAFERYRAIRRQERAYM